MQWIMENYKDVLEIVAYVIAIASVIVKFTPNKWDDNIIAKFAQFIALNKK
jgi:hypothetical protein